MADGLSWYFQLVDRVTGPAKDVTRSLSSVSDSASSSVEKAKPSERQSARRRAPRSARSSGLAPKARSTRARAGIAGLLDKVEKVIPLDALKAIGGGFVSAAGSRLRARPRDDARGHRRRRRRLRRGISAAGFKMAAESADAKRTMLIGLQAQLGADGRRARFLDEIEGYAKKTASRRTVYGLAKSLPRRRLRARRAQAAPRCALGHPGANGGDAGQGRALVAAARRRSAHRQGRHARPHRARLAWRLERQGLPSARRPAGITLAQAKALFESGASSRGRHQRDPRSRSKRTSAAASLVALGLKLEEGSIDAQLKHLQRRVRRPLRECQHKAHHGLPREAERGDLGTRRRQDRGDHQQGVRRDREALRCRRRQSRADAHEGRGRL
jgi:hypothetical protein